MAQVTPYYQTENVTLYCGDCLKVMKQLEAGSVDAVVTDPPYGCGKADWDVDFPTNWYAMARRLGRTVVVITGSCGTKDSVNLVGADFVDVIAAWNLNSLTRGPLGFNNWLAAVVAGERPKVGNLQNFFEFAVRGQMPSHPSPKPIEYMTKLLPHITRVPGAVLDPFMGSGTTGVACVKTGRKFIGIEISAEYCAIAEKRIREAEAQLPLLAGVM